LRTILLKKRYPNDSKNLTRILWTPAMQAGLVKKPLSFREIFTALEFPLFFEGNSSIMALVTFYF
jgi:hypothetical protein